MAKVSKQRKAEAIERLTKLCPPGSTVYTVLRDVSRSGMSRNIDCYVMVNGEPYWVSRTVADACGMTFNERRECIRVGGCGMDMGFHIVYSLSATLYPNGFGCIGDESGTGKWQGRCPSNDHSNGDRNYVPHGAFEPNTVKSYVKHWHNEGGYALRHKWM